MNYRDNIPFVKHGLEVSQLVFSGGRAFAGVANHGGLTRLEYWGRQHFGGQRLYVGDPISDWGHLFRFCLAIDDKLYYPEFHDTLLYPFGYESRCALDGVTFRHGMYLLNDALVYTADIVRNPKRKKVAALIMHMDHTRVSRPERVWDPFAPALGGQAMVRRIAERYAPESKVATDPDGKAKPHPVIPDVQAPTESETFLAVLGATPVTMPELPHELRFSFAAARDRLNCALVFGHAGRKAFLARLEALREGMRGETEALVKGYRAQLKRQPRVATGRPAVDSCLANAQPLLDSMRVKDIPGGMRASSTNYWIWGWDSIVFAEAYPLASDPGALMDRLDFYERTAHPQAGIFHQWMMNEKPRLAMAPAAQTLYAVMLYRAAAATGDLAELERFQPFARRVMRRAAETEAGDSGLLRGVSLFMDHPQFLGQDGNDISVFNNSIYYQALRAMAALAGARGRADEAADYAAKAERFLENWPKLFDEEKGYFYDSIAADTFQPRKHYPAYAVLWLTPFAADLVRPWERRIAAFMRENFTAGSVHRMLPRWDTRYLYSLNESASYMPVAENFYREMMRRGRHAGELRAFLDYMAWNWDRRGVPEGLLVACENAGATPTNPGNNQAFCIQAWVSLFYQVVCGMEFDLDGIRFSPSDPGQDIAIRNLVLRGKRLDIAISGRGWRIGSLQCNGRPVDAPYAIAWADLRRANTIVIHRTR